MSPVTLDISTLVMLLINVVAVVGAFYTLKSDIAGVKKDIERVVSDLGDIKKKAEDRGHQLDEVVKDVAVLASRAEQDHPRRRQAT